MNPAPTRAPAGSRVLSIDAFRGYAILNMIFFNDLDSVAGLPRWMHHAPKTANWMTYVDIGVPAFLLIMGMAIPFAMRARRERGERPAATWAHILLRSAALIMMGTWMAFGGGDFDPERVGMSQAVWGLWMFLGFFLLWYDYPSPRIRSLSLGPLVRGAAAVLLFWLYFRYHQGMRMPAWLPSWWGVLGSIGWSYLIGCIVYAVCERFLWAVLLLWVALLPAAYGAVEQLRIWHPYVNVDFFLDAVIVLAGVYVSQRLFLRPPRGETPGRKIVWLVTAIGVSWLAGYAFEIPFGISKDFETPSFLMYGIAANLGLFLIFYCVADAWRLRRVTRLFLPFAKFPLTIYLFVEMVYAALEALGIAFQYNFDHGLPGVLRSIVFTGLVIVLMLRLARLNLRLSF